MSAATGNHDLYDRLCRFEIDELSPSLTFVQRLARENNWTESYSDRVVVEYKRFLYLMVVSGHPVTPSDQVDQAWHLHLTYTKSYWERLCADLIGRPLHHTPTNGGPSESEKFENWYDRTKQVYRSVFGEEAPTDIWPKPSVRFGTDLYFQRLNVKRNWIFSKPTWLLRLSEDISRKWRQVSVLSALSPAMVITPTSYAQAYQNSSSSNVKIISFFILVCIGAVLFIFKLTQHICPNCYGFKLYEIDRYHTEEEDIVFDYGCSKCGHRLSRTVRSKDSGGSGGCGSAGCGGCGGCGG
ncbi:MAG: hypothetical protein HQ483_08485 [Rhodospirillales bacterium]|nr:hypothetical protein [Rhodospirillales bacterium]